MCAWLVMALMLENRVKYTKGCHHYKNSDNSDKNNDGCDNNDGTNLFAVKCIQQFRAQ